MSSPLPIPANTPATVSENRAFFPALDGLRALAFLMVFFQHYMFMPWGWTGVNIFFVLSGFLITGILYDTRDSPHRVRNFYVRRTLRIFPLYYAIFLALLIVAPWAHWRWSSLWLAWPLYLGNFLRFSSTAVVYLGSPQQLAADAHLISPLFPHVRLFLGHFWSLAVEEQFYLVWPWVVFAASRRTLLWICGITVVLVPLLRVFAQAHAPQWMLKQELLYRLTPFQFDSLLLGGLLALLLRGRYRQELVAIGRIAAVICVVTCVAYVLCHIPFTAADPMGMYVYPAWRLTWGLSAVNITAAAMILCCLQPGNPFHAIFVLRPLRWLGRISYGAYVFHDIFHNVYALLIHNTGIPVLLKNDQLATALLGLVGSILLAWLSFTLFEQRFLNLKERLSYDPEASTPRP